MILRKASRVLEHLSRFAVSVAFIVLIVAVTIQIIGRSFVGNSPVWTEELTRFALLFLTALGAGLSYRSGTLINVDAVCESLPGRWPWRLRLFSAIVTAGLCIVLIGPAWTFASIGAIQTSPALGWRMDYIYISITVLLASLMLFSIVRIFEMLTGISDGSPPSEQEE